MVVYAIFIAISFALIGYLLGSILFGVIISKISQINLRKTGSQNIGATNVSRTLGKRFGILVSLLDALKAYLGIILCWIIFRYSIFQWFSDDVHKLFPLIYISGIFTVLGHCWPVQYLIKLFASKFDFEKAKVKSGGKGVACSGGTLFAISPWLGLIALFTFIIILLICRYVSLGSMICMLLPAFAVFIPRIAYLYLFENNLLYNLNYVYTPTLTIKVWLMGIILCNSIIVIIRHSSNIKRLINREEKRFI